MLFKRQTGCLSLKNNKHLSSLVNFEENAAEVMNLGE